LAEDLPEQSQAGFGCLHCLQQPITRQLDIKFLIQTAAPSSTSRGSVISPRTALAATVSGLGVKLLAMLLP
jgi:hypothetical protein